MPALPKKASAKRERLLRAEADVQALINAALRDISDANRLLDNSPHGARAPSLMATIAETQARLPPLQKRHHEAAAVNAHVGRWLESLRSQELEDVRVAAPRLRRAESALDGIDRIRRQISELRSSYRATEQAAPPIAEVAAQIKTHVEELARRNQPKITFEHGQLEMKFPSRSDAWAYRPDLAGLLAWLDPKALVARVAEDLASEGDTIRLSAKDKTAKLEELRIELDQLEREEEALIDMAFEAGQFVERRGTASAAAILGVREKRKAKAAA